MTITQHASRIGEGVQIRRATPGDRDVLFDIWFRSASATHTFVPAADIQSFIPLVRDYLASSVTAFWVLCDADGRVMGFMGTAGQEIESLFLAPEFIGRGGGRRLIEHARTMQPELVVDVNEQNTAAVGFYKACGFIVEGRSELDANGRPYPLLHLRLAAGSCDSDPR